MKLPGIYVAYAGVLATFGETARGIHLGLLVVNLVSGVLVTAIYLAGLLMRSKRQIFGMGVDSALVLLVYLMTLGVFYHFS